MTEDVATPKLAIKSLNKILSVVVSTYHLVFDSVAAMCKYLYGC